MFFWITIWHSHHIIYYFYDAVKKNAFETKNRRHSERLFFVFLVAGPRIARGPQGYAYHFGFRRTDLASWSGLYLLPKDTLVSLRKPAI